MSERDELIQLLQKSVSIDDADRDLFISTQEQFSLSEIRELLKIFRYERDKLESIDSDFNTAVSLVDAEFHQLVSDFKHHKFPAAIRENEISQKNKDTAAANTLLQDLDTQS